MPHRRDGGKNSRSVSRALLTAIKISVNDDPTKKKKMERRFRLKNDATKHLLGKIVEIRHKK